MPDKLSEMVSWLAEHVHATDVAMLLAGIVGWKLKAGSAAGIDRPIRKRSKGRKNLARFMKLAGGAGALATLVRAVTGFKQVDADEAVAIPTRQLGSMGFNASVLGMGGVYIPGGTELEGIALLDTALELGINYFDTASQYGDGESERRYGIWLERLQREGRRNEVFIATKTLTRGFIRATEEIEGSAERLRTDRIDLLQVHAINDYDTWRTVNSRIGSMRAIENAKDSGLVRHIGISGHGSPEVMLTAIEEFPFDSVLIPLGITDRIHKPYVEEVLPKCIEENISCVAMKVFAEGKLVNTEADLQRCLHYTLSLPMSTAIIGMKSPEEVIENVAWTLAFAGMTEDRREALANEISAFIDLDELWWKR